MVIVDCLTDNPNRTFGDVRGVSPKPKQDRHARQRQPYHHAIFSSTGNDEEAVLEALMEADVDVTDIEQEEGRITVFALHTDYAKAKQALLDAFGEIDFEVDEIQFLLQTTTPIEGDDVAMFENFWVCSTTWTTSRTSSITRNCRKRALEPLGT